MKKTKIVIVGAGFGGVAVFKELIKNPQFEVTIIDKNNYFLFTPMLHEVATGGLEPTTIAESLISIRNMGAGNIVLGTVSRIDREKKVVVVNEVEYPYDHVVVATGAETAYFGIPGAKENGVPLKTLRDAETMKEWFINLLQEGKMSEEDSTFAVVGAGPTGIELICEMAEFLNQILMCAESKRKDVRLIIIGRETKILPMFSEKIAHYAVDTLKKLGIETMFGKEVEKVEPKTLYFKDGSILKAKTIIWVPGVTAKIPGGLEALEKDRGGRVVVNEYLQSMTDPDVFALGDAANFMQHESPLPMLAQVAARQGEFLGKEFERIISGRPILPFHYRSRGSFISLGQWRAAGELFGYSITGAIAWWIWRTIYLFNFKSNKKRLKVAIEWTINLFYPRDITRI